MAEIRKPERIGGDGRKEQGGHWDHGAGGHRLPSGSPASGILQQWHTPMPRGGFAGVYMPGKVVLANIGTLGDLHPLIAIALRLRKDGYDAVSEPEGARLS